jgi:hypothetical protein
MTIDDIIDQVAALDGVLVLHPQPGDGSGLRHVWEMTV